MYFIVNTKAKVLLTWLLGSVFFSIVSAEPPSSPSSDEPTERLSEKVGRVQAGAQMGGQRARNEALVEIERHDSRKAELVKLRYFAGLSVRVAAETLGIVARGTIPDRGTLALKHCHV